MNKELSYLLQADKKIVDLNNIVALLSWDMETLMPENAIEERSAQMSHMAEIIHTLRTDVKIREAVEVLLKDDSLSDAHKALVLSWEKFFKTEANLPLDFVKRYALVQTQAHAAWVSAREKDDYSIFAPVLKQIVELLKEKTSYIDKTKKTYDLLLDDYETGMTEEILDKVFDKLEKEIHNILDKFPQLQSGDDGFLNQPFDQDALHEFCMQVYTDMGYDAKSHVVSLAVHPFSTKLGSFDVRQTTRYFDSSIFDPIATMMHEGGHSLYEEYASLNPEIRGLSIASGVSMGIHESQSRFWENIIGRSSGFWKKYYSQLVDKVPSLKDVSREDFVKAINKASSKTLRVNADELTYGLHIILRYRMEKLLMNTDVDFNTLPEVWNDMSEKILRYRPANNKEGILQDVHWSSGLMGYFPTYALGNLYCAMFTKQIKEEIENFDDLVENGDFGPIKNWFKDKIWNNGAIYKPAVLLKNVTGKELSSDDFIQYLLDKYSTIYSLES